MDYHLVQYHAGITILTVLCVTIMSVHVAGNSVVQKHVRRYFHLSTAMIALCAVANCVGGFLDTYHQAPVFHIVATTVELCCAPFIAVFLCGSCGFPDIMKKAGAFAIANIALQLVSIPFGLVYRILPDGTYVRGDFYFAYLIPVGICVGFAIMAAVRMSRMYRSKDTKTLVAIFIVLFLGILAQTFIPTMKTVYIAVAVASLLFYVHNDDLIQSFLFAETQTQIEKITSIQHQVITGLAEIIDRRDESTGAHVVRTSQYVNILAREAQAAGYHADELTDKFIGTMTQCAYLHDVGKITVSDMILNKPGKLTPEEFEQMKAHAEQGGEIIGQIMEDVVDPDYLKCAKDIATYHHEKWDGSGYPEGLAGEEIPLCARIMAVADVYDAIAERRIYKSGMSPEEALDHIAEGAGAHFDPTLAALFVQARDEVLSVKRDQ